jgi:hypothetical protein
LVHKIRLKPTKKKIVGGSTCFTCSSDQSKARCRNGAGAGGAKRAGSYCTSSLVKVKAQKDKRLVGPFLIWLKFEHVQGLGRRARRFFCRRVDAAENRRRVAAVRGCDGRIPNCLPTMPAETTWCGSIVRARKSPTAPGSFRRGSSEIERPMRVNRVGLTMVQPLLVYPPKDIVRRPRRPVSCPAADNAQSSRNYARLVRD